jgi:hypothetical protein
MQPQLKRQDLNMKLNEAFPSKFLKADDLDGQPRLVIIEAVRLETVEEGKPPKPVLALRGLTQALVCNKTNGTTLASFLGDDLDLWPGKKIVLYPSTADFQGRQVPCIRVRQPKPQSNAPGPSVAAPPPPRPSKQAEELPSMVESDVPF